VTDLLTAVVVAAGEVTADVEALDVVFGVAL
jgi:hypothetical protein